MIDTTAIVPMLVNLFVGVRETGGTKSDVFEESARAMLRAGGSISFSMGRSSLTTVPSARSMPRSGSATDWC
ncbi:MAG: hypothetical protein K2Y20_01785 [Sphingomonas sp.]|nr:hypothetical protein [Sphingomonas sp.]